MTQSPTFVSKTARLDLSLPPQTEGKATFRYSFTNNGDRNMYLFNRIWRQIGRDLVYKTDVNTVYVELVPEGVLLSKKVVPVPDNMGVEQNILPCMTRVAPGATFAETVELAVPVRPETPYLLYTDKQLAAEPTELDAWFELGLLAVPPEGDELAHEVSTTEGPAYHFDAISIRSQQLLRASLAPLKLKVRLPA